MQTFRRALPALKDKNKSQNDNEPSQNTSENSEMEKEGLRQLSLNLAAACRTSLARSWVSGVGKSDEAARTKVRRGGTPT